MEPDLNSKVVLVTAGSKGIGLAGARAFRDEGARVGIVSNSPANLNRTRERLGEVAGYAADLVDPAQALAALDAPEAELFNHVDMLDPAAKLVVARGRV